MPQGPRFSCERQGSGGPKDNHVWGKLPPEKEVLEEGEELDQKMRKRRMGHKRGH